MASKSAVESEDELMGGLDGEGSTTPGTPSGIVIVIGDGVRGNVGDNGGVAADEMNLPSGPRSGRRLDARTSREKNRDETIVLRALVRGCIYNVTKVAYLRALVRG
jgi:hypothetical protein